jgi:ATP-dependent DNA helicase RecQ
LVYVTRQETAEEVATFLNRQGVSARAYHAGLPDAFRSDAQHAFMTGATRVIAATIAFGMGIDKADIRGVIHYNLPKSLENHTQEIGRAGRDGKAAVCELFACADDVTVLENFVLADTPTPRALENLVDRVLRLGAEFDVSVYDLSVSTDIRATVVSTVLAYLETAGIIESTGVFYGTYRVRLLRPRAQVLAGRPAAERAFLTKVLDAGAEGRSWLSFDPTVIAGELVVSRGKVVAAIAELEAAGDAALMLSHVRQGFRVKKDPGDLKDLSANLAETFIRREQADLVRIRQVLGLASCKGCLTNYLTIHFGEKLAEPCGHCDRCRGLPPTVIRRTKPRRVTDDEWRRIRAVVNEGHAALGSPRQLARFLCGMSSPAATRARLGRHDAFGLLGDLPFSEVLAIADVVG